ncbi:MAG TPA: tetratricopeptide repeat protein [Alphaproteobacteria bacterium]|nr:tetratricopeptide repeat protein [Alphaproteobacteria bacterium]
MAVVVLMITAIGLRKYHRMERAELGLTKGLAAYEAGRWDEAATYLGHYLSIKQQDTDILIKYARSQIRCKPFKRERLAQAVNAYRAVLRNEKNPQAAKEVIEIYLKFNMPAEAEFVARNFVADDQSGQFRQMLADSLFKQRKYEEAVEILSDLVSQKPDQVMAFKLLGEIEARRSDVNEMSVQQWFDKAVEKNPTSAQAYILRGSYFAKAGYFEKASQDLENAEKCDISKTGIQLGLAAGWLNLFEFDKARKHLEVVREMDPSNESLWYVWATLAVKTNKIDEMLWVAEKGLFSLGSNDYAFLPIATELFVRASDLLQAEKCIEKLRDAQAERGIILYLEGLVLQAKMDWAGAIKKWQHAIYLGYSSEEIYLELSRIYDQIGNHSLAIQVLRRYISRHEESFQACLRLSKMYAGQGYWTEAAEQSVMALWLNPNSLEACLWHLRCCIETVNKDQDKELTQLKQDIQKQIDIDDSIDANLLMFRLMYNLGDYVSAEQKIDQIEKQFGPGEQILLRRAELSVAQKNYDQAIVMLEDAVKQYPDSYQIKQMLVWNYVKTNQLEKGRQAILAACESATNALDVRRYKLWLAEHALLEGKHEEAVDIYKELAEKNKGDVFVRRQLLALQFNDADADQLQQWINEIKETEGDNGWQWKYEQARLWYERDDFQLKQTQIIELLNDCLTLNPDDQSSRILLASCYERAGNLQLALSCYRDVLVGKLNNINLIVAAVGTMYRAGEYDQAQKLLNDVNQRGIWDERLSKYELQYNIRLGHDEDAKTVLEKMVENAPQDTDARLSLALMLIRGGDFEEAQKQIDTLSLTHPDSVSIIAAKADLYVKQQQPAKALEVCDEYLSTHDILEAYIMRSQVLLMAGKTSELVESLEKLQERFGDNGNAMTFAARLYQEIGYSDKALNIIKQLLLTKSGGDFVVQKQAALLYLSQKSLKLQIEGQSCLDVALKQNPNDLQLRLKKAEILIQENNAISLDEAKTILSQIVQEYPTLDYAWVALRQISLSEGNLGQSMDYLMRGLSYSPKSELLLKAKAQIESMRSPALAVDTLESLYEQNPNNVGVLIMLSENYRKAGQPKKALELFRNNTLDSSMKESIEFKREKMAVLWDMGEDKEAEKLYEESIQQSDNPAILLERIQRVNSPEEINRLYWQWADYHPEVSTRILGAVMDLIIKSDQSGVFEIAMQTANNSLKLHPDSDSPYFSKAMLLHKAGEKKQAIPWYEKALELNPESVIAINNLAWIFCMEEKEYKKALELANRGLVISPNYVDLIDTRGNIYMNMGEYEKAVEDFSRCSKMYFEKDSRCTVSIYLLGKCLFLLGKKEQAQLELLKARQQNLLTRGLSRDQSKDLEELLKKL